MKNLAACAVAVAVALGAPAARAQDIAPPEDAEPDQADATSLKLGGQLGGSWSTGNTQAMALNGALRSSLTFGANQLTLSGVFARSHARTAPDGAAPDAPPQDWVADDNVYARLRYDRRFLEKNELFVGFLAFRDPSSGFKSRYMPYAGYARILFEEKNAGELWIEAGWRVAHEALLLDAAAATAGLPDRRWLHGPTVFVGGRVALSKTVEADVGAEVLTAASHLSDVRINTFANLISRIAGDLSFGVSWNSRYLHDAIGDRRALDTSMQVVFLHQHDFKL